MNRMRSFEYHHNYLTSNQTEGFLDRCGMKAPLQHSHSENGLRTPMLTAMNDQKCIGELETQLEQLYRIELDQLFNSEPHNASYSIVPPALLPASQPETEPSLLQEQLEIHRQQSETRQHNTEGTMGYDQAITDTIAELNNFKNDLLAESAKEALPSVQLELIESPNENASQSSPSPPIVFSYNTGKWLPHKVEKLNTALCDEKFVREGRYDTHLLAAELETRIATQVHSKLQKYIFPDGTILEQQPKLSKR